MRKHISAVVGLRPLQIMLAEGIELRILHTVRARMSVSATIKDIRDAIMTRDCVNGTVRVLLTDATHTCNNE